MSSVGFLPLRNPPRGENSVLTQARSRISQSFDRSKRLLGSKLSPQGLGANSSTSEANGMCTAKECGYGWWFGIVIEHEQHQEASLSSQPLALTIHSHELDFISKCRNPGRRSPRQDVKMLPHVADTIRCEIEMPSVA